MAVPARRSTLAAKLDAVEAHLRKMERDSAQKSDKADRAAEAAPTLPVQKSAMAPVPKGGALQKWQENRRRRDENIAKDIAAIRNNMKP